MTVDKLDYEYGYVFKLGNLDHNFMPTIEDLVSCREAIETAYLESDVQMPPIVITHPVMDIEETPLELIVRTKPKINRLETVE